MCSGWEKSGNPKGSPRFCRIDLYNPSISDPNRHNNRIARFVGSEQSSSQWIFTWYKVEQEQNRLNIHVYMLVCVENSQPKFTILYELRSSEFDFKLCFQNCIYTIGFFGLIEVFLTTWRPKFFSCQAFITDLQKKMLKHFVLYHQSKVTK